MHACLGGWAGRRMDAWTYLSMFKDIPKADSLSLRVHVAK